MRFDIDQFKQTFTLTALQVIADELEDSYKDSVEFKLYLKILRKQLFKYDILNIDEFTKMSVIRFIQHNTSLDRLGDDVYVAIESIVDEVETKERNFFQDSLDSIEDANNMDLDASGEITIEDVEINIDAHNCYVNALKPRIKDTILNKYK